MSRYIPQQENMKLLRKLVKLAAQKSEDSSGSFKTVRFISYNGVEYAVKKERERPAMNNPSTNLTAIDPTEHYLRGYMRASDIQREIATQHISKRLPIVPYIAWGTVDGKFWGVQRRVEKYKRINYDQLDVMKETYKRITGHKPEDWSPGCNTGVLDGKPVAFDWGYDSEDLWIRPRRGKMAGKYELRKPRLVTDMAAEIGEDDR